MFVVPFARSAVTSRAPAFSTVFDRLFDDSLDRFVGASRPDTRAPAMDVVERDDAWVVSFDVPGARKDDLKIAVEGRRVVLSDVRGTQAASSQPADAAKADAPAAPAVPSEGRALYRERSTVAYARTVVLPAEVDAAGSQAKFENGVLTLVLGKKVPTGAAQLAIA